MPRISEPAAQHAVVMIRSIDTANGSEFINHHLQRMLKAKYRRCRLTRSRPYRKNDNARALLPTGR